MKCVDCKFWKRSDGAIDPDAGECHRQSPSPMAEALAVVMGVRRNVAMGAEEGPEALNGAGGWSDRFAVWPTTFAEDFCGEFARKSDRVGFV
jgi:hypothetical protein